MRGIDLAFISCKVASIQCVEQPLQFLYTCELRLQSKDRISNLLEDRAIVGWVHSSKKGNSNPFMTKQS